MIVTVVDRDAQHRLWGKGYNSIHQILRTIEIADTCPCCGGPRGQPYFHRLCEDGEWYDVSRWSNPCGHLDTYAAVIEETRNLERSA